MRFVIVYKINKLPLFDYVAAFPDNTSADEISDTLDSYLWKSVEGRVYESVVNLKNSNEENEK